MVLARCGRCDRANPEGARFCYFDGQPLSVVGGGPQDPGKLAFPTPFVFPSGTMCRNFDEFCLGVQQNWQATVELLQKGHLERFLANIGRLDLAQHAAESGATAVVLATPYYFPAGQTELTRYVCNLTPQLPLPLMLYNMPSLTKCWFDL